MDICKLMTGFSTKDVVVFDTETTGVSGSDEILSIAIVDVHGNDVFNSLIRPTRKHSWPNAERIHHISPKMVQAAPTANECKDAIMGALAGKLVVGYNVDFDLRMLDQSIDDMDGFSPTSFDVMKEYAKVHGRRRWEDSGRYKYSKLFECAEDYGYTFSAHDAHEDAVATAYCFMSLVCDEAYVSQMLNERGLLRPKISMSPLKAMCANIQTLVGDSGSVTMPGSLVVGHITRGRRKGQKRYECVVDGLKVGVVPDDYNAMIFASCLDSSDSFPEPVKVNVTLGVADGKQYSEAMLEKGIVLDDVLICARQSIPNPADYAAKHFDGVIVPDEQPNDAGGNRQLLIDGSSSTVHVEQSQDTETENATQDESRPSYSLPISFLALALMAVAVLFGLSAIVNLFQGRFANTLVGLLIAAAVLFAITRLPAKDSSKPDDKD